MEQKRIHPLFSSAQSNTPLTLGERDLVRIRYDVRAVLDERGSTRLRIPNPEHSHWLGYALHYGVEEASSRKIASARDT